MAFNFFNWAYNWITWLWNSRPVLVAMETITEFLYQGLGRVRGVLRRRIEHLEEEDGFPSVPVREVVNFFYGRELQI